MAMQGEGGRWWGGAYEVAAAAGSHVQLRREWRLWGQKSKTEPCGSVLGRMRDVAKGEAFCGVTGPPAAVI
jgi:hypothetical protein